LDHNILIYKLYSYGFRGIFLDLLTNYLTDRKQFVYLNGASSHSLPILYGVPQGSILGPLLFLLYINDIHKSSNLLKFFLFADDTTIFCSGKNWVDLIVLINQEMDRVADWLKANKLSLNVKKTKYIVFRQPKHILTTNLILVDGVEIEQVSSTKFLGIEIDSDLTWKIHIHKLESKLASIIGVIGTLRFKLNIDITILLYNTLILPHLNYCNLLWASNYKTSLTKIHNLQKRFLRICHMSYLNSIKGISLFQRYNILTIYNLNRLQLGKFSYKALHGLSPCSFDNFYTATSSVHTYKTRHSNMLFQLHYKSNLRKMTVRNAGQAFWNQIQVHIQTSHTIHSFINSLKGYLPHRYLDS